MWLCLNKGYLSIVRDKEDPFMFLVRSRKREHITEYFPYIEPERFTGTDYAYRIRITSKELKEFMMNRMFDLDYDNFKDSVEDKDLKDFYSKVWLQSFQLETEEDYEESWTRYYESRYESKYNND